MSKRRNEARGPRALSELLGVGKALSDEARLRALAVLGSGELCLCHLVGILELAPSTVSRHLDILTRAGLVERRKAGRWTYFKLAGSGAAAPVRRALAWVTEGLATDPRTAADARRLDELRCCSPEELVACYRKN